MFMLYKPFGGGDAKTPIQFTSDCEKVLALETPFINVIYLHSSDSEKTVHHQFMQMNNKRISKIVALRCITLS